MKYKEFTDLFNSRVYNLRPARQLQLAINICKRLFPDYRNFVQENNWGNPDILLDAIKACEQADNITSPDKELKEWQSKVDKITPHMDDFGDEMGSYALNACIAVYHTLQFLIDKDPSNIVHVGTALTDTIDSKVQEDDDLTDEEIDNHLLMKETQKYLLEETMPD